ncbi:hypothetical protein [Amnibacterium kyonggiense]|uniref:hypothetical protein n=1 Tax=Amnibacterium kyonggiense TaxID=595671 RepID=UPI00105FBB68|nr:hypothetical protein [Amnibacterium kyonggiense]
MVDEDVAWIRRATAVGGTLRSAIPGGFDVYGLLDVSEARPTEDALLRAVAPEPSTELIAGWIDRGPYPPHPGDEHVLYSGWRYRFQRIESACLFGLPAEGEGGFPDLLFPDDRSWLISLLWDDSWRSVGASHEVADRITSAVPSFERVEPDRSIAETGRDVR